MTNQIQGRGVIFSSMPEKKNLLTYSRNRPIQPASKVLVEPENQRPASQAPSLLERIAKGLHALKLEAINLASPRKPLSPKTPLQELEVIAGEPQDFSEWLEDFSKTHPNGSKIGESSFSEVFHHQADDGAAVAVKIMPLAEGDPVMGKTPEPVSVMDALHEVRVLKALSNLADERKYTVPIGYTGFNRLMSAHLVKGLYPKGLLSHWDLYQRQHGSENHRPGKIVSHNFVDFYGCESLHLVMVMEFGGTDLEGYQITNVEQACGVIRQIAHALHLAEDRLSFEHRDL